MSLAGDGYRPPCGTDLGRAWVSEDPDDRRTAIRACTGCELLDVCAAAGADEEHGVWGGIDRSRNPVRLNEGEQK